MKLWEHLEDLRLMFFKIIITLVVTTLIALSISDDIIQLFLYPIEFLKSSHPDLSLKAILTGPFDSILIRIKTGFLVGLVISFPLILYFIWNFINPALKKLEKKAFFLFCLFGTLSLTIGIILGYLFIFPMLNILLSYTIHNAENFWTLRKFINFIFYWLLGAGLFFEIPFIVLILIKLKILDLSYLKKLRPYIYTISCILAAILTPPDPFTMIIIGICIILLFELGFFLGKINIINIERKFKND